MTRATGTDLLSEVLAAHRAVQQGAPLIQCITNRVVPRITADVLLAVGASPAMVDAEPEAGQLAAMADGLLVNVGTVTDETAAGMRSAVAAVRGPWVLDPVGVGGLSVRTAVAGDLLDRAPAAVRGNASEIRALAGVGTGGRGVDSIDDVASASEAAHELARRSGAVVAVSGPVDLVVAPDGRCAHVEAGHPLLTKVVGTGCSLGGVVAAYLATVPDAFTAVVAAHAHCGAAGGAAAAVALAPGSFAVAWVDALYTMHEGGFREHCRLETLDGAA